MKLERYKRIKFSNKYILIMIIVLLLVLSVSIGYCYLSTNLSVNGSILVKAKDPNSIDLPSHENGSLHANYFFQSASISDFNLELYKLTSSNGITHTLTSPYYDIVNIKNIDSSQNYKEARKAFYLAQHHGIDSNFYQTSGLDGQAYINDLDPGVYLVYSEKEGYYPTYSLITVPKLIANDYNYNINYFPKIAVLSQPFHIDVNTNLYLYHEEQLIPIMALSKEYRFGLFVDEEAQVLTEEYQTFINGASSSTTLIEPLLDLEYYLFLLNDEGTPLIPNEVNVDSGGKEFYYNISTTDEDNNPIDSGSEIEFSDNLRNVKVNLDIVYLELPEDF